MFSEVSPHGNAATAPSQSHQQLGMRAACDRCRGQKLRCRREHQSGNAEAGKCFRCNTADAVCSFSQSKRSGRPPASASSNITEPKSGGKSSQGGQVSSKGKESCSRQTPHEDASHNQNEKDSKDVLTTFTNMTEV